MNIGLRRRTPEEREQYTMMKMMEMQTEIKRLRGAFIHNTKLLMVVAYETYVESGVAIEEATIAQPPKGV